MADFLSASGVGYFAEAGKPLPLENLVTMQVVQGGAPIRQQREEVRRPDGTQMPILLSAVTIDITLLGADSQHGSERAGCPDSQTRWTDHLPAGAGERVSAASSDHPVAGA